jgi:hypothetical protein
LADEAKDGRKTMTLEQTAGEQRTSEAERSIMHVYPESPSVSAGALLQLCVEPPTHLTSNYFKIAFFQQGAQEALVPVDFPLVEQLRYVTRKGTIFSAAPLRSLQVPDIDWQWPRISCTIPRSWPSGVYFAAVYTVDSQGNADTPIGQAIERHQPITTAAPWSDALALFVVTPSSQATKNRIAYILAVSTYHAYNYSGEGCYYYGKEFWALTLRRPGGGVGTTKLPPGNPEVDFYDCNSPHNTFAHWDAKFIQWLAQQSIACDFYTTFDIVGSSTVLLSNTGQPAYPLAIFVGHDEYWDQTIRNNLTAYQNHGGNIAIFSGNTCYRPVSFSDTTDSITMMTRLNGDWVNQKPNALLGVSFGFGGASYGYINDQPRKRWAVGMQVQKADHWVFTGTGLKKDDVIGKGNDDDNGTQADHLVGYECDGLPNGEAYSGYQTLAVGVIPQPSTNSPYNWNDIFGGSAGGRGCMVITDTAQKTGVLFNAATTDWARVLTCSSDLLDTQRVQRITQNVLQELAGIGPATTP